MNLRVRRLVVAAGSLALVVGGLAASSGAAQAAAPPYEPDPGSIGAITFYDASGHVVTGGSINDAPFATYVQAAHAGRAGDTKATLFGYLPKNGIASGAWSGEALTASTTYPNAAAPSPLGTSTLPLVSLTSGDSTLATLISDFPNTATDSYQGLYQIRVKTSGVGQPPDATYDSADILVSGTTWSQVYPAVATSTTTALSVTPASPQIAGTTVTLKATVTPSTAAGTVQFKDGSTNIGSAVTVSGGIAQTTTSSLAAGTHSLTAVFTPTSSASFSASTSSAVSYTITSPATSTTTALSVTPASPVALGTSVTVKATVTPSAAAGSVQFFDGAAALGSAVSVSGGLAQLTTSALAGGVHALSAKFTPTDATAYTQSTSSSLSFTVTSPATTTTTALDVTPASPVTSGSVVTLKATVSPSAAAGTVKFFDGATQIGSAVTVSGGVAQTTTAALSVGTHSLTAAFTPTNVTLYTASTSSASSLTVNAIATSTALSVSPASPATQGATVVLKATITPSAAAGTVQFKDGGSDVGSPVTVSGGVAQLSTTSLGIATHSLTATFSPSGSTYLGSTSSAVSYVVVAPVAGSTTTTIAVSPSGSVLQGTSVKLTATVSPTAAAGTVQFFDGATALGSPVTVASAKASLTTTALGVGTHALSATFTPTNSALYNPSTSASVSLTVKAPAVATSVTLAFAPASPVTKGTSVTVTASLSPTTAVGNVQFLDGTKVLGTHAVVGGSATLTISTLAIGTHSLGATFVPTDTAAFKGSTSTKHSLVVKAAPAVTTTTVLDVTPPTTAVHGDSVKLKATVTPTAAAGKVQFLDGTKVLATTTVSSGVASFTTTALSVADHKLSAKFVPTSTAAYAGSTSAVVDLKVTASATPIPAAKLLAKSSSGKTLANGVTLKRGDKISVTGSGFDAAEKVTITVHSTPVVLGTVVSNGLGTVTATVVVPSSLAAGSHTLTLTGGSTSGVFAFKIAATSSGTGSGSTSSTGSGAKASTTGSGTGDLPFTGGNVELPVLVGLLLLVIGAALVAGTRQRRRGLAAPAHRISTDLDAGGPR